MREMKDSGIEWIGEIPEHWQFTRISSLYGLRSEKVSDRDYPPLSVTKSGILPQLETVAKTDAHDDRKLVKCGDFVINSRSDRRGSCGISKYDGSVSLINTVLYPIAKINSRYYNWFFHTETFADEFYKWGHGIVDDLWTTGWQDMKNITVIVPPIEEQKKISDYLDEKCNNIDSLISELKKQIEILKEYKRSVITEAVTRGLNPNAPLKDSGIEWVGEIPTHWKSIQIKHLFSIVSGATPNSNADNWNGDILWITPADYKTKDKFVSGGKRNISKQGFLTCSTSIIPKGSIIFSKRAPIGTVAINTEELCTNQGCLSCISKINTCNDFFYYVMSIGTEYFKLLGSGTTFKEISMNVFANCKLPFPPIEEQEKISTYLDEKCNDIDKIISGKQQQIEIIEEYKKSLIFEYVIGTREINT